MNTNRSEEQNRKDFEILFVDDEKEILAVVKEYLALNGFRITVAESGFEALELMKERSFDIVFTDLQMPKFNGIELLTAVKEVRPDTDVIIVTGHGTIETAVRALKLGGYDYLQKPLELERLKILSDRLIEKRLLLNENRLLKRSLKDRYRFDQLVGVSQKMQRIYDIIERIKLSDPTVLIQGESGTGKEILAKVIHHNSGRKDKPFIAVNCGAIVEGLLESELFGHLKGAFTGAVSDNIGLFRAADGGTLFLDEVSEITPPIQVKLLRVLQEKKVRPVGGTRETAVDVRVIAATNRDLEEAIRVGALRKDLYYRLNVVSIMMPPLVERKEDISLLINHFLNKYNVVSQRKVESISPEAMDLLINYHWPGNVRQLENVIERAFALGVDTIIQVADLPAEIRKYAETVSVRETNYSLRDNEVLLIKKALRKTRGNKAEAAKLLGVNTTTVYRKMERYGITETDF